MVVCVYVYLLAILVLTWRYTPTRISLTTPVLTWRVWCYQAALNAQTEGTKNAHVKLMEGVLKVSERMDALGPTSYFDI